MWDARRVARRAGLGHYRIDTSAEGRRETAILPLGMPWLGLGEWTDGQRYALALSAAVLLGIVVRAAIVLSHSFPVGDGGLFFAMVGQLSNAHFAIPRYIHYNGLTIPFAYPPLGFYFTAGFQRLAGVSELETFRVVPLFFSGLSVVAFAALARATLDSRLAQVVATLAFGLLPDAFHWEVKGGGITRAPAQAFALFALAQLVYVYRRGDRRSVVLATLFSALTVVTHPEWTFFLAYSAVLLFLVLACNRDGLRRSLVLAAGVLVLSAPWWMVVVARFGSTPLVSAMAGSAEVFPWQMGLIPFFSLSPVDEVSFPIFTALALTGLLSCVVRRDRLLPIWAATILVVNYRGPVDRVVVVVALLAGVGAVAIYELFGTGARDVTKKGQPWKGTPGERRSPLRRFDGKGSGLQGTLLLAVGVVFLLAHALYADWSNETSGSIGLSKGELAAMSWVRHDTPAGSRFAVVSSAYWALDANAEWFPVLADRVSVNTVQGSEWIRGAFARRYQENSSLQGCGTASCIQRWRQKYGEAFDYVFVARTPPEFGDGQCCQSLLASLDQSPGYRAVYRTAAVVIYRRAVLGTGGS